MASAGLLGVALASCSGSDDAPGGGTKVSFFVFNEPSGAYQEAADTCSSDSGGKYAIVFELLPNEADAQREQLVRRLGAEDTSIDIIGMDVIWSAEFANAGWLRPWEGELRQEVTDDVFDSVIESASFEGTLYSAPYTSNTQLLWYREDRVDQAPETWEAMVTEAERLGADGKIQVQGNRYEGFTVWVNSMLESAGAQVLAGPEEPALPEAETLRGLEAMTKYASSEAAPGDIDTSTEDSARLSFEAGGSTFMINYPFVYPSAKENAPDVFKKLGAAKYPAVEEGKPSRPPLGGINLGISKFSENPDLAFEAAACLVAPENQIIAAELGGLPPVREGLYSDPKIKKAYPGFADLIKQSIDDAAPRPLTPAYTDLSLGIQRALHPIGDIAPDEVDDAYEKLRDFVEQAVKREGLL
ncbi:MAG: extracellular solute-binding protein [Actinomycetota bacterium]|nr:extracellular solute-binding protein [Actinomycetota bacterium]